MYPLWSNIVREAEIKLEYEAIQIEPQSDLASPLSPDQDNPLYAMPLEPKSRQIRLLVIQPGNFDDPISCQMIYAQLDEQNNPDFDALSYVCGPPEDRVTMGVHLPGADTERSDLSIIRTAETAIRHLRNQSDPFKLWVDVACINQNNYDERAQQVRMMATIFARARLVHVWLGSGHEGHEAAVRLIRDIYNLYYHECDGGEACNCRGTRHTALHELEKGYNQTEARHPIHQTILTVFKFHWNSFSHAAKEYSGGIHSPHPSKLMPHFFGNAWFRRVWVIQEVLKSRVALVHCGKETVTWKELTSVNSWLDSEQYQSVEPHLHVSGANMPRIWSTLAETVRGETGSPSNSCEKQMPSILDVFVASLDLKSMEPRDKIFAILSLGRETSVEDKVPTLVRPNYSEKTTERVFADFTRWWIIEYKSLSILSLVHSNRYRTWQRVLCDTTKPPPSPRPSWTVPSDGLPRWFNATLDFQFKFRASGTTVPDVHLLDQAINPLALTLMGYTVAKIDDIKHLALEHDQMASNQSSGELAEVFHKIFDASNMEKHWKSQIARDRHTSRQKARINLANHLHAHREVTEAVALFRGKGPDGNYQSIKTLSVPTCTDPCLFTASNGMVGLCPWTARKGDAIVVLFGGAMPYLLRAQAHVDGKAVGTNAFEFIGECFVMDIMHGEFLRAKKHSGMQAEQFVLI